MTFFCCYHFYNRSVAKRSYLYLPLIKIIMKEDSTQVDIWQYQPNPSNPTYFCLSLSVCLSVSLSFSLYIYICYIPFELYCEGGWIMLSLTAAITRSRFPDVDAGEAQRSRDAVDPPRASGGRPSGFNPSWSPFFWGGEPLGVSELRPRAQTHLIKAVSDTPPFGGTNSVIYAK